ncbi:hypothetical protein BAU14_14015 [Enterococcus sp. CU9D]|nr:hypothetical protein BAU14_14015 [Enterococcus sp. CU9D]
MVCASLGTNGGIVTAEVVLYLPPKTGTTATVRGSNKMKSFFIFYRSDSYKKKGPLFLAIATGQRLLKEDAHYRPHCPYGK